MTSTTANRRQFMQALGAAGAVAVAGCLGDDDVSGNSTPTDEAEEGLPAATAVDVDRIARDPTDLPPPVDWTEPREHEVTIRTERVTAEIEPEVTFEYMTFE
ncbi:twin-arginine translocation signal domain-containing protein, partial [Halopiger djelfimassiliensis]|uniref:twin-arginine translocation signal domain-containing protein n=1 Tax=Halopiger djelfimassiliensis TaxID=1293047 RepID=UPI0012B545EA